MKIEPALSNAVSGIQKGIDDVRQAAHEIATANTNVENSNPTEVVRPLIDLKQAELQVAANAEVIKTEKEMVGFLLDELT